MYIYSLYDPATGRIHQSGVSRFYDEVLQTAMSQGLEVLDYLVSGESYYIGATGEPLPRPLVEVPEKATLTVGQLWELYNLPVDTEILVDYETLATIDATGRIDLQFDMEGVYVVDFKPPFPWFNMRTEVTVNDP